MLLNHLRLNYKLLCFLGLLGFQALLAYINRAVVYISYMLELLELLGLLGYMFLLNNLLLLGLLRRLMFVFIVNMLFL